jgi:hypothetical protein
VSGEVVSVSQEGSASSPIVLVPVLVVVVVGLMEKAMEDDDEDEHDSRTPIRPIADTPTRFSLRPNGKTSTSKIEERRTLNAFPSHRQPATDTDNRPHGRTKSATRGK